MNTKRLTSFLVIIAAASALAATEERINKHFTVPVDGRLVVDVDFGSIDINTNSAGEVTVDVWRKVTRKSKADEEAYLRDSAVQFNQEGTTVTVRSHEKTKPKWSWGGRNSNDAKYTITVPSRCSADLATGGGGITVVDLTGETKARTGGGDLRLARLTGPVEGRTGGGGIKTADCAGKLKLNTGGGGVEVAGGSGSVEARTGGGGVTVRKFDGPAHVDSGGGGLTIEAVTGAVDGSTGGGGINALLPSELAEPVTLSTAGGGINVGVPSTAAFSLDAKTAGGGVHTELAVSVVGKLQEGRLQGPVNGGGKSVTLRSGGGDIRLKKL